MRYLETSASPHNMASLRHSFAIPIRNSHQGFRLSIHSRQQLRYSHAGFANKQEDPLPLKHMPRKTTKPEERQKRHEQKMAGSRSRQAASFAQPPLPILSPSVQEVTPTEAYFIRRTPTRNLPVYQLRKRGGNLKQTRVRKIEGEGAELVRQLEDRLDPKPQWIRVNPLNGHVEMKVRPNGSNDSTVGSVLPDCNSS